MQITDSRIFNRGASFFTNATCGVKKTAENIAKAEKDGKKSVHTASYLMGLERTGSNGEGGKNRASEIIEKARRGQKLTQEELDYLAKESPENYQKIKQAMENRKMLEEQMKSAKTKQEAQNAYLSISAAAQKTGDEITIAQMNSAFTEYTNSDDYQTKPESLMTEEEREEAAKHKHKSHYEEEAKIDLPLGRLIDLMK